MHKEPDEITGITAAKRREWNFSRRETNPMALRWPTPASLPRAPPCTAIKTVDNSGRGVGTFECSMIRVASP